MLTRVITNGDSLLGYGLALKLLTTSKREGFKYRVLCRENQGLAELERLGADVVEVDYQDRDSIRHQLRDVSYVILIPEFSKNRLKEAEMVLECAQKENIGYVTLISFIGVGSLTKDKHGSFRHLKDYAQVEKWLPKYFKNDSYCVMRLPILYQFFYYLGPMMEDEEMIRLPVNDHAIWCAIDMNDALEAICKLSEPTEEDNRILFEFTPSERNYSANELKEAANEGLERDMTYSQLKREEMIQYLRGMHNDNRFRERPRENPSVFPLGQYLNKEFIETLIEYWEISNEGCTDTITTDLKNAIGCPPLELKKFFKDNRHQFNRLRSFKDNSALQIK